MLAGSPLSRASFAPTGCMSSGIAGFTAGHEVAHVIESRCRGVPRRYQRIDKRLIFCRDLHRLGLGVCVPLFLSARPDDGRGHGAVVQHPGDGEFDDAYVTPLGVLLDLLGNAQRFNAPFGFEDAFVLTPARLLASGFTSGAYLPLSTPRASGL